MELLRGRQFILCFSSFEGEKEQESLVMVLTTEVEMTPSAKGESPFDSLVTTSVFEILLCVDVERSPLLLRN